MQQGERIGTSSWHEVTQPQIDAFADATGDHQWIHVDPARAADGPFGTTIAHGYLTLSLAPGLLYPLLPTNGGLVVNYGLNKVRFPAPVPVGSRVRLHADVAGVDEFDGGRQVTLALTFEREGAEKPVCVAEAVYRFYA
jgi:acyl dehydratase